MDDELPLLTATLGDVRCVTNMLRALSFQNQALVEISENGLNFTVEQSKSFQAKAYLPRQTFDDYTLKEQEGGTYIKFMISISIFLECLNIFGSATLSRSMIHEGTFPANSNSKRRNKNENNEFAPETSRNATNLRLSYEVEGGPLVMLLEENGIVTRCELSTYEPDDMLDLMFDDENRVNKLIMNSEGLKDALNELEASSERLVLKFNAHSSARGTEVPVFKIEATGDFGTAELDYFHNVAMIHSYDCPQYVQNSYYYTEILVMMRALSSSTKVAIRTEADGLISFQYMFKLSNKPIHDGPLGFIDFLFLPLHEDPGAQGR